MSAAHLPGRLMKRSFFEDAVEHVAPCLLGKLLVRRRGESELLAGRIVEVEAYLGPHHATPDAAAHSYRGPTPRNQVMFGPAGHAYVYAIYGMHFCMNITCEPVGRAGCVLLRALEPVLGLDAMARNRGLPRSRQVRRKDEATRTGIFSVSEERGFRATKKDLHALASGPGRLCQALAITRAAHNGVDLLDARSPLQVRDDGFGAESVLVTKRIGIRHAADLPLRFCLADHRCVSGPRKMEGRRMKLR